MAEIKKTELLFDTVVRLLRRGAHANVRRLLLKSHPSEIAGVIRQMSDHQGVALIGEIRQSDVEPKAFAELGGPFLKTYLSFKDDKAHVAEVLQKLPEDEAAALLAEVGDEAAAQIMALMHDAAKAEVTEILEYDEGTCGRIMAVNIASLNQKLSAREAIDAIQKAETTESLFYIYVIDDFENLVGVVSLRQLLQADKNLALSSLMAREVIRITAYQSQEEAAHLIEEYNFVCLPVVNETGKLIGMVTVDDIIDFIRDEAQDDVLQMAGVESEAIDDFSYWRAAGSRGFWYLMLFVGGIFCSELIMRFFPGVSEEFRLIALAPLVLRLGGSIATQTSTFTQQSVLNGDIERGRAFRALWGQNAVTLAVAVALSLVAFAYAAWRFPNSIHQACGSALSLFVVAVFSLCLGMFVPLAANRLRLDSPVVSSRFFHFVMDVLSLFIFFYFTWRWRQLV